MKVLLAVLTVLFIAFAAQAQTCTNGQVPIWSSTTKWTCGAIVAGPLPAGGNTSMTVANAGTTGTTVNRLAKLTGAPSTAVISATSDTENAIGVVTSGAGTTGNAIIAILGQVTCDFDGATTAGNYVTISSTTAGKCHDAGSSFPTGGATYGRVLSTNGASGAYVMELMTPDIAFQNAGSGKSKPGGSTTQVQYNNAGVFAGGSDFTYTSGQLIVPNGSAATPGLGINGTNLGFFQLAGPIIGLSLSGAAKVVFNDDLNVAAGGGYKFSSTSSVAGTGGSNDTGVCRSAAGVVGASNGDNFCTLSGFAAKSYTTATNCADSAGAAACGSAAAGSFVIDAGATTVVVSTTAVTANSEIFVQYDSSLGTRLSVTCNATVALPAVTARTAATSFTITVPVAPVTNPTCYSYHVVN